MGSDSLIRPDDEDSAEFKEYIQNLLTQQINRAKSGYAAPSSGSADAYIAKLNRLKLERRLRRKLGLAEGEDDVDLSYQPADYQAALAEGQEVQVAAAGGAAGGVRVRPLTREEIMQASAAEANVRALSNRGAQKELLPPVVKDMTAEDPFLPSASSDITGKSDPAVAAETFAPQRSTAPIHTSLQAPPATSLPERGLVGSGTWQSPDIRTAQSLRTIHDKSPASTLQELISRRDRLIDELAEVHAQIKGIAEANRPADHPSAFAGASRQAPQEPSYRAIGQPPRSSISPLLVPDDAQQGRDRDQRLKLTLGLLLKHRGGPGFGHGRLQGRELELLEAALRDAAGLLREEATAN